MGDRVFDGRQAFEELLHDSMGRSSSAGSLLTKSSCVDTRLLKIAEGLSPEDPLTTYRRLGGGFQTNVKLAADGPPPKPKTGGLKPWVNLFSHQREAVDKIIAKNGNLLLSHPVGSGKTLTAIAAFEAMREKGMANRALVVAPASLRTNFVDNGVKKFTNSKAAIFGNAQEVASGSHVSTDSPDPHAHYHVVSYELFRADPKKYIDASGADTVIYDELHRAKNEGVLTSKAIREARQHHRNFIGMTGSIVSNSPADIVPLVDAMTDGKHLLGNKTTFEARFVETDENGVKKLRQPQVLRTLLNPYVHHIDAASLATSAPKKIVEEVRVEMSPHQRDLYKYIRKELDPLTELRLKAGATKLNNAALNDMFAKLLRLRQVSNSIHTMDQKLTPEQSAEQTPKIKRVLDDVAEHIKETPDAQVVIHTNMIQGGVDVLTAGLRARGIDHALFIGKGNAGVTEKTRQHGVKEFQEGKKKVIVLSAAGGEGLDLPNATMMCMVDGHFNPERINQAEARGIRAGGQSHRPEDKRQVLVRRYVTVLPTKGVTRTVEIGANIWKNISPKQIAARLTGGGDMFFNPFAREKATDEWVYSVAKGKSNLNEALHSTIKQSSAEMPEHATHEEFEAWLTEGLEKSADFRGGMEATGRLLAKYPEIAGAGLGGLWGLAVGGTPPRTAQEAKQDPRAPIRNRLSSALGGAVGGAIGAYGLRPLLHGSRRLDDGTLRAMGMTAYTQTELGAAAGRNIAGLYAPKSTIPQTVQDLLGDRQDYSDKELFGEYWKRFGDELEQKGVDGKLSDEELEKRFVIALKDLYTAGKTTGRSTMNAKETAHSKKVFKRMAAVGIPLVGGSMAGISALMQHASGQGVRAVPTVMAAVPATMAIGGALAGAYRRRFLDPGVSVSNKAQARTRSKFSDDQLRDLLRGKAVEEVKVKAHVIK